MEENYDIVETNDDVNVTVSDGLTENSDGSRVFHEYHDYSYDDMPTKIHHLMYSDTLIVVVSLIIMIIVGLVFRWGFFAFGHKLSQSFSHSALLNPALSLSQSFNEVDMFLDKRNDLKSTTSGPGYLYCDIVHSAPVPVKISIIVYYVKVWYCSD